jgi:hypothetical protein
VVAERLERPLAGQRKVRPRDVQGVGFILERRDVLAHALRAVAEQVDLGRHPLEAVGEGG